MRLFKYFILIAILASSCRSGVPYSYDYTPTLLHVNSYKQHDSIGFNMATELPKLLYSKILSGDVPIWDSPDKQVRVEKGDFMEMEQRARVPFVENPDLFIHQVWNLYKRSFSAGTMGFTFTTVGKDNSRISYGFVDAADVIVLMKDRNIPCNANGTHELSYWNALESMRFEFNLVQFGNNDFKDNPLKSFKIKDQAIKHKRIHRSFYAMPLTKEIEYKVTDPAITSNKENKILYDAINKAINDNKQIVLNAGGASFLSHLVMANWKVDQVIVVEKWTKQPYLPLQELREIKLFINGGLIRLGPSQIKDMGMRITFQQPEEFLSGKSFNFIVQRINSQEIAAHESEQYYNALLTQDWNKIK
jgi:hypothetical protein